MSGVFTRRQLTISCLVLVVGCAPRPVDSELMTVVVEQDTQSITRLLKEGADPSAPLHDGWTATMIAVRERKHEALQTLLMNGADPNASSGRRYTPLMWAVFKNDEYATRLLISFGADPCQATTDGTNAFHVAIKEGNEGLQDLLPRCD